EDGIRDFHVTGVQTCALPIGARRRRRQLYRRLIRLHHDQGLFLLNRVTRADRNFDHFHLICPAKIGDTDFLNTHDRLLLSCAPGPAYRHQSHTWLMPRPPWTVRSCRLPPEHPRRRPPSTTGPPRRNAATSDAYPCGQSHRTPAPGKSGSDRAGSAPHTVSRSPWIPPPV